VTLQPIKLYRGDPLNELVETFAGFTEFAAGGAAEQSVYSGDPVSINNNATKVLPVTNIATVVELLDRTNPLAPTFLAAGAYGITFSVTGDALTAGGYAVAIIQPSGGPAGVSGEGFHPPTIFGTSLVAEVAAGDPLGLYVTNKDGIAARSFSLNNLTLVKL
jgi:hypothetical protein